MSQIEPAKGGLRWVGNRANPALGTPPVEERVVLTNNSNGIFAGDPVKEGTDGCMLQAAAGDAFSHVMVSVKRYRGSDGILRPGAFLPAATTYTGTASKANPLATVILVIPVDGQVFETDVPTAAATQTAAEALIGQCVDVVVNAGSTITGQSGVTADTVANFQNTTVSAQLRLRAVPEYGMSGRINDVTQTYWKGHFTVHEISTIL